MTGPARFADLDGSISPVAGIGAATDDELFFRGPGLFETVLAESGRLPFASAHFARMRASALRLGLPAPPEDVMIAGRIRTVLRANGLEHTAARLRLRLCEGQLLIVAGPVDPELYRQREEGIAATVLGPEYAVAATPEHKTLDRSTLRSASRIARDRGAAEALIFDASGHLLEGASSNVFHVRDARLYTPPLQAGILPGVTRSLAISIALESGFPVEQSAPDLHQLTTADEVFLTSAIRILVPVIRIDDAVIAQGRPGAVSRMILERLLHRMVDRKS